MVDRLVVLGICEVASMALVEQELRTAFGTGGSVAALRARVEVSVYWPAFVAAVQAGEIDKQHPDLPSGPLGELLLLWALEAAEAADVDDGQGEGVDR